MSEEQLDLFDKPAPAVRERCREKYGGPASCVPIWDASMTIILRYDKCREWCPLLNEPIE